MSVVAENLGLALRLTLSNPPANALSVALMERPQWDTELLDELGRAMIDAWICGLGQAAPNPIACVVRYFPDELK